jgi:predicted aspartyl protease
VTSPPQAVIGRCRSRFVFPGRLAVRLRRSLVELRASRVLSLSVRVASRLPWILLASCGPAVRETPPPRESGSSLAASVPAPATARSQHPEPRSTRLSFELNGRAFPLPLLHGTVSGEPVWMLVDTGANSHVIASWVARRAGMTLRPLGHVGSDHAGRSMSAYAVDHPNVTIDGWGVLADAPMLVADVPEAIAGIGIGAFVSPQWLAGDAEGIVLDLGAREMRSAPWDDAARELADRGGFPLAPAGARLCESLGGYIKGVSFVLSAIVDGRNVDLLLDTGAERTDLLSASAAGELLVGRSVPSREQMYAAAGLVQARFVRAAHVRVGGWAVTTDIDLVPGTADSACPRDGVVSMDALASCTLVINQKKLLGTCFR